MFMHRLTKELLGASVAVILLLVAWSVSTMPHQPVTVPSPSSSTPLRVIAAENFWGSIAAQIGGDKVHITSIVTDPNADPHEYESSTQTAIAFSRANYIIENGAGYDSWVQNLLSAESRPGQKVLDVATLLGKKNGDNPHFWYDPNYVETVSAQIEKDYIALDPQDAPYFQNNYQTFQSSLAGYVHDITQIKQQYSGVNVASTESIFVYMAQATGLNLISPPAFMQAISEGNDPPAQSVVDFQNQLKSGEAKLLVYNKQTVTPITTAMLALAQQYHVPVVGITETVQPPDMPFQDWMQNELTAIMQALHTATGK